MDTWPCEACTFENKVSATRCIICETPRKVSATQAVSRPSASPFNGTFTDGTYKYLLDHSWEISADVVTVDSEPRRPECPSQGLLVDNVLHIFGLRGTASQGGISWSNGQFWRTLAVLDADMEGEWFYMRDKSYSIKIKAEMMIFEQKVAEGVARGDLFRKSDSEDGDWWLAHLMLGNDVGGRELRYGTICLKQVSGVMMSRFKAVDDPVDVWGDSLIATRSNDDKARVSLRGSLGAKLDGSNGQVIAVDDSSKAQEFGVKVGWKAILIDEAPFSKGLLQEKLDSGTQYCIAFDLASEKNEDLQTKSPPVCESRASPQSDSMNLAVAMSLSAVDADRRFGKAIPEHELRERGIYYEAQELGSATCAQNALNNLAQHRLFSIEDLGKAEVQQGDTSFDAQDPSSPSSPTLRTGYFDIEAIKWAASAKDLQVVDVEPKANYRESELPAFLAGCRDDAAAEKERNWFKGFLVYDSRPGRARHFYALVARPGCRFLLLNSLQEEFGAQNRYLTEEEVWDMHEYYSVDFKYWVFRWYPVISKQAAILALQDTLRVDDPSWCIKASQAESVIQACRWQVAAAATRLLHDDVSTVLQRFRAGQLVIARSTAQKALEAADGDAVCAAEKLAEALRIQAASPVPEVQTGRKALNAAGWSIDRAVSILELAGAQPGASESFEVLCDILQRVDWHFDNAAKVKKVMSSQDAQCDSIDAKNGTSTGSNTTQEFDAETVAGLLEDCRWDVEEVGRVIVVQRGHPHCPVPVIRTVLQRNHGDASAAIEMLKDFMKRVSDHVIKSAGSSEAPAADIDELDVVALVEAALERGNWRPTEVLNFANQLVEFTLATKAFCAKYLAPGAAAPASSILWALRETRGRPPSPEVVARMLLWGEDANTAYAMVLQLGCDPIHAQTQRSKAPGRFATPGYAGADAKATAKAKFKSRLRPTGQEESSECSCM